MSKLNKNNKKVNNKEMSKTKTKDLNKSLRGLREITPNSNIGYNKMVMSKKADKEAEKKGAIPVKNIRQKICGNNNNSNKDENNFNTTLTTITKKTTNPLKEKLKIKDKIIKIK